MSLYAPVSNESTTNRCLGVPNSSRNGRRIAQCHVSELFGDPRISIVCSRRVNTPPAWTGPTAAQPSDHRHRQGEHPWAEA